MLALTALTIFMIAVFSLAVIVIEIWHPEEDIGRAASRIAVILTNLITGIFAYTAGRNVGARGNGNSSDKNE